MPNSSDLSQGAAERAGYIHGLPESTQADFLSGRMGFAMGFDNTNQIMVDLWSEGFQPRDIPAASAADDLGRYCQAREQLAAHMRSGFWTSTSSSAPPRRCAPGMTPPSPAAGRPSWT